MKTVGTLTSTCANVKDVVGGRKTLYSVVTGEEIGGKEGAVLVNVGHDDAVVFSDEVESVPSLESEETDDEEEEEEDWESEEEEEKEEEEYDEEDAELDEGLAERLRILADARALKTLAAAFLHPEEPVKVADSAVYGRNYFERPSAPKRKTDEDADEEVDILEDARMLKLAAAAYLHPEVGVTDAAPELFGRNYFERPSAPEVESVEEAEERARVLADAVALKRSAVDYMHPEVGVRATGGACFGRNYFNRPSAPETEEDEFADERAEILAEAAALKESAMAYMHPEVGVIAVDGACFGRNFFNRPSAPETEDALEAKERALILAEADALKKSAVGFMHPEVGVAATDPTVFGRNYFNRPLAPETEEDEFADERAEILAEASALKKLAADYMHPEVGVTSADGACFGRNYFERPSAPETEDLDEAEEHARVLADALALKKSAADYMHPEVGVSSCDATLFGRNYFNRASAPETEDVEEAEERALVLADALALKNSAADYMNPEVGVTAADGASFGRNYFNRPSAPETEEDEFADERAEVLAEAAALKKLAADYMHPEVGVSSCDATLFGRNYFNRASAPETEDAEEAEERALALADALALKKSAADYMHPEVGVTSAGGACFGRNYFNRPSAPETEDDEFADERAEILAEAAVLKKLALDYMHPEVGVYVADGTCFARNYFNRASAPETEDVEEAEERARVLAEAASLKKSASDYMHPEVGVSASDATLFGRNYFNRISAPETEDVEEADERARVVAEAAALKKSAVDFMHPEVGVSAADGVCFGRNFFNRPSAPETEDQEFAEERALVLAEAAAFKMSAVDFMHPEVGVTATDPAAFGRNYFNRYSAPGVELPKKASEKDESPEASQEMAAVKSLAAAVKGANLPSTKTTKLSSTDSEVGVAKKSASTVNLFGLSEVM